MNWRDLRVLVFGETWIVPAGVALVLASGGALDAAGPVWWPHAGGFVLLALVVGVLLAAVASAARAPRGGG